VFSVACAAVFFHLSLVDMFFFVVVFLGRSVFVVFFVGVRFGVKGFFVWFSVSCGQ